MRSGTKSLVSIFVIALAIAGALLIFSTDARIPLPEHQATTVATTIKPAKPSIKIYATEWGLTLAEDGSGFYNDLANLVLDGLPREIAYDIRPYRRAKALFYRDPDSCLYPSTIKLLIDGGEIKEPSAYLDTDSFLHVKVFIFSRPNTPAPSTSADVNHKSVAYAMGARIPYFLKDAKADFIAVADEIDKARMLLTGRVDLMTAALPDAKFVFDKLDAPLPPFDTSYMLNDTEIRITCHNTPAAVNFAKAFNQNLGNLLKSGALRGLFVDAGLNANLYLPKR